MPQASRSPLLLLVLRLCAAPFAALPLVAAPFVALPLVALMVVVSGCALPAAPSNTPEPGHAPGTRHPSPAPNPPTRTRPSAPAPEPAVLLIGSWNIRRLGHGTKDLGTVASVLSQFDIVATQEVMTREVIEALRKRMPGHDVVLTDTPRPQEGSYKEYFAFFYRPDRVRPTFSSYVPDPENRFVRDPFVACFSTSAPAGSNGESDGDELCLMTLHIVWGKRVAERKNEILALDDAMRWAQSADTSSAWIVLGDFNRVVDDGDADDAPEDEWAELLSPQALETPVKHIGVDLPTTLGKNGYANAYDHIFVSEPLTPRVLEAGRYDFVAQHCAGEFETCKSTVSDHAPVTLRLRVAPAPSSASAAP